MNTILATAISLFSLLGCAGKEDTTSTGKAPISQSGYKQAVDKANDVSALSDARNAHVAKQDEEEEADSDEDLADDQGTEGDED